MTRPRAGAAAVLAACATGPSPWLLDPERTPHPECPPQRFVVAAASSPDGPEAARSQARAAVARQVRSRIAVETRRVAELTERDGAVRTRHELLQRIEERAEYRHAHLIRIVGAVESARDRSWALACLERAAAVAALERELAEPLAVFREQAAIAAEAAARGERAAFAAAYRRAAPAAARCLALLAEIGGLAGRAAPAEVDVRARWTGMVAEAARIRAAATFRVQVEAAALPADLREAAGEAFRAALAGLDLRTAVVADGCGGDAAAYLVRVRIDPECAWGSLGHRCAPAVAVRVEDCGTGRVVSEAPYRDQSLAAHDGRDPERALRKALRGLAAPAVAPWIASHAADELPPAP